MEGQPNPATGKLQESLRLAGLLEKQWSNIDTDTIPGYGRRERRNYLEGLDDPIKRMTTAVLLENAKNWLRSLNEMVRTQHIAGYEKMIFDLVRCVMANLVANDLVSVQPLNAPIGVVFYMNMLYGSTKGRITTGTTMYSALSGPATDDYFTSEKIEQEQIGVGDGSHTTFAGNLGWLPVKPNTVRFVEGGGQLLSDNGNGVLAGNGTGTINYATGAYSVTFTTAPAAGQAIVVDYDYVSEGSEHLPQIDLQLAMATVTTKMRTLRTRYSIPAEQDFKQFYGLNMDVELLTFMTNEILREINYEIVRHLRAVASAGTGTWQRNPPAGVPYIWHKESLYYELVRVSNMIFAATQRVTANWVLAGVEVCNVIETLSNFKPVQQPKGIAGVRKIGTLGDWAVYKDPTFPTMEWLMGHKGGTWLDTGYIYGPYLAPYISGTIVLDDLVARKAMAHRYATKVINSRFYARGVMTQSGDVYQPAS